MFLRRRLKSHKNTLTWTGDFSRIQLQRREKLTVAVLTLMKSVTDPRQKKILAVAYTVFA